MEPPSPSPSVFVNSLLIDHVRLKPWHIGSGLEVALQKRLARKLEGVCTHHGYIRANSIKLFKWAPGVIQMNTLNGDVLYKIQFYADVCNPVIGSVVTCKIVNRNKFGLLAESLETDILEVVVPLNLHNHTNIQESFNTIQIGDMIRVEVIGKKFELGDCKISVVGSIVKGGHVEGHIAAHDSDSDDDNESYQKHVEDEEDDGESIPDLEGGDLEEAEEGYPASDMDEYELPVIKDGGVNEASSESFGSDLGDADDDMDEGDALSDSGSVAASDDESHL